MATYLLRQFGYAYGLEAEFIAFAEGIIASVAGLQQNGCKKENEKEVA